MLRGLWWRQSLQCSPTALRISRRRGEKSCSHPRGLKTWCPVSKGKCFRSSFADYNKRDLGMKLEETNCIDRWDEHLQLEIARNNFAFILNAILHEHWIYVNFILILCFHIFRVFKIILYRKESQNYYLLYKEVYVDTTKKNNFQYNSYIRCLSDRGTKSKVRWFFTVCLPRTLCYQQWTSVTYKGTVISDKSENTIEVCPAHPIIRF